MMFHHKFGKFANLLTYNLQVLMMQTTYSLGKKIFV